MPTTRRYYIVMKDGTTHTKYLDVLDWNARVFSALETLEQHLGGKLAYFVPAGDQPEYMPEPRAHTSH